MKTITPLLLIFTFFANAQFYEDFEQGVPGTMIQTFSKGQTSWIDFGLSALNVDKALSEKNSAVFYNAMDMNEVVTALQTPILDLSNDHFILEFNYFQKQKTEKYVNLLALEISTDGGKTWKEISVFDKTTTELVNVSIDLSEFALSKASIIKFKTTQSNAALGYPIVIDDITVKKNDFAPKKDILNHFAVTSIFPNPSSGLFHITTNHPFDISVIDVNGKIIYAAHSDINQNDIDLTKCAKGLYFAQIKNSNDQEIKKLIIQ